MRSLQPIFATIALLALVSNTGAQLRVPAFTAYLEPLEPGPRVSSRSGVTRWTDPGMTVSWFGDFKASGKLDCALDISLPVNAETVLSLTGDNQTNASVRVRGNGTNQVVPLGSFEISGPGYQRLTLRSLNPPSVDAGNIQALILSGPPIQGVHFNLKPRRNAASVHLSYDTRAFTNIDLFYCEVTAIADPVWTFYMACGWHRGYFGMQVNSPTERRIIFSVWDSGNEAVDRDKVSSDNRVSLIAKGEGVYAGDFGNEGTGGHSHLKYSWDTGEKQRFVVTAKPVDATHTVYSGYYFDPERGTWRLISSWKAPKEGGYLRRLHSFSENFVGDNGQLRRKALYGNQWIRTTDGAWAELTTASFSHDETGRADRTDRFMGIENGQFFLSHGGFLEGYTGFGERFTRPAKDQPPTDLDLPSPGRLQE